MARSKMLSDHDQALLTKEYYETICRGDAEKLTYKAVAEYISLKTGLQIKEHSVRRCESVRNFFNSIRNVGDKNEEFMNSLTFKSLDIDEFIRKNNNLSLLRTALKMRDNYYQSVCESAAQIVKDNEALAAQVKSLNRSIKEMDGNLRAQVEANDEQVAIISEQKSKLEQQNRLIRKMRRIIDDNVNAKIASKLLKDVGLLKEDVSDSDFLKQNAVTDFTLSATDSVPDAILSDSNHDNVDNIIQGLFDRI